MLGFGIVIAVNIIISITVLLKVIRGKTDLGVTHQNLFFHTSIAIVIVQSPPTSSEVISSIVLFLPYCYPSASHILRVLLSKRPGIALSPLPHPTCPLCLCEYRPVPRSPVPRSPSPVSIFSADHQKAQGPLDEIQAISTHQATKPPMAR